MPENGITVLVPFGQYPDPRFGIQPVKYTAESAEQYVSATVSQIMHSARNYRKRTFSTVYFGGCEPSLLTLDQLYRLLQALYDHLSIIPVEQTLITSAGSVDAYRAKVLKELSFDHITIRIVNEHIPAEDFNIYRNAGFHSVGFEVCFADRNTFSPEELSELVQLKPDHLYFLFSTCSELPLLIPPVFKQFLPGHYALPGKENRHLINLSNAVIFGINR
ncbi:MAG: hypothetical protein ACPL0F_03990 [bacterium]|jgi:hypothetical protein